MIKLLASYGADSSKLSEDDSNQLNKDDSKPKDVIFARKVKKRITTRKVEKSTTVIQKCMYLLGSATLCLAAYVAYRIIGPLLFEEKERGPLHSTEDLELKNLFDAVEFCAKEFEGGVIRFMNNVQIDEISIGIIKFIRDKVVLLLKEMMYEGRDGEILCGSNSTGREHAVLCITQKDRIVNDPACVTVKYDFSSVYYLSECSYNISDFGRILLEETMNVIHQLGSGPGTNMLDANVGNASSRYGGHCNIL